jgi:DNA topoisomerase-3
MILYIAEKPSLGRAIADVLPKPHRKEDGCIRLANGDVVSWCIGHLLELAEPEHYDERYQKWRVEDLPIVPSQWEWVPKKDTRKQLTLLRKLIKEADEIVHAGDPDREGQLLVDEVIQYLKVPAYKKDQAKRLLISDLNPSAVKKALHQLRFNREFIPLSTSALARSRADWMYGMNMTRLCTVTGRQAGYNGVLSVGRVQTPVLGLVVERDQTIENFVSKPFYEVWAHIVTDVSERFKAKWKPSEACQPHQDEEGRVLNKKLADNVVERITGKPAKVSQFKDQRKKQAPPLPYNLSALQIDAAKRFQMSAKTVLDVCQGLYEKHKLITYPRSDNRYLPKEHFQEASSVVAAIERLAPPLAPHCQQADLSRKSKAWDDKKVGAHHAIIPTAKASSGALSQAEKNVYELIARQYLIQFFPFFEYDERFIELIIEGGVFQAKARVTAIEGWKALFPQRKSDSVPSDDDGLTDFLPKLSVGDMALCERGDSQEKHTQPPKPFTDATLMSAMTGISRYVKDADIRKILRETDGLGTEATRASILELLFRRNYLNREGKNIRSTETGRRLINSLPEMAVKPDMTAQWESQLSAISEKQQNYQAFMGALINTLPDLMSSVEVGQFSGLKGLGKPPVKRRSKSSRKPRAKKAS